MEKRGKITEIKPGLRDVLHRLDQALTAILSQQIFKGEFTLL